jgi:hypothetical protein
MVHPGSRDWRSALQAAGISLNAPTSDVTTAVHALGLEWWFIESSGADICGNPSTIVVVRVWQGPDERRPTIDSEDPIWDGCSDRSRDEALGLALRNYFSTL